MSRRRKSAFIIDHLISSGEQSPGERGVLTKDKAMDEVKNEEKQGEQPKIVVCMPGASMSYTVVRSLLNLAAYMPKKYGMGSVMWSLAYHPYIWAARAMCLGWAYDVSLDAKPFKGEIDYTHILWIDNDICFDPWMLDRLLKHDRDIVGAGYLEGGKNFLTGGYFNDENVGSLNLLCAVQGEKLIEVDFIGLGFCLIKKGVFESMPATWFIHKDGKNFEGKPLPYGEDVSFCKRVAEQGYKIYLDPIITNQIGHEKKTTLFASDIDTAENLVYGYDVTTLDEVHKSKIQYHEIPGEKIDSEE